MRKIELTCSCGNTFDTEAKAELDVLVNGEGGKWTNVICPECGEKYTIKLTVDFGHA